MLVLDGDSSTLDPSFEGNCAPIRQCATVWWENWVPVRSLNKAYVTAQNTIGKQDTPKWNNVKGPTAALIATIHRLNWKMVSSTVFLDDEGFELDCQKDSPDAIVAAASRSTRR